MGLFENYEWVYSFNPSSIIYIVPLSQDKGSLVTSLSGFNCSNELYPLLQLISELPNDINELLESTPKNITYRLYRGDSCIFVCELNPKEPINKFEGFPFLCFLSTSNTYEAVSAFIKNIKPKPIHITTKPNSNAININKIKKNKFRNELYRIATYLNNNKDTNKGLKISIPKQQVKDTRFLKNLVHYYHNITNPNRTALISQGIYSKRKFYILPNMKEKYKEYIASSANFIIDIKKEIGTKYSKNHFILAVPSLNSSLYRDKEFLKMIQDYYGVEVKKFYERTIRRSEYVTELKTDDESILNDLAILKLSSIISNDLFLFTSLLSILAAENFSPTYRLPNSLNLAHSKYDSLVSLTKSQKLNKIKANRVYSELVEDWKNKLDDSMINSISNSGNNGIIVSDYPLEWLTLSGVIPLNISHNVCRINSSPGDLLIHQTCNLHNLIIQPSSLQNVLIIRSFEADDPIKYFLEKAIHSRKNNGMLRFLNVNIVDVKSESEFIDALRNFTGKIVIIDCHGNHGGHKKEAWLKVGDDKVNIWNLKADFRIPPIFLLSACSTHPIDGSNTSVANGLISIGAHSVLATLLPISADHSAIFISKFLHWIDFYLAIDKEKNPTFTLWRDIVSDIMRSMYVQDILNYFEIKNLINEHQSQEILIKAQIDIMYDKNPNWFENLFRILAKASNKKYEDLVTLFIKECRFSETMHYSHLGRPDKVIVMS